MQRNLSKPIFQASAIVLTVNSGAASQAHASPVHQYIQVTRIAEDSTNRVGGPGGSPYNLSCSEGQVLVGVSARAGHWLDGIEGICRSVTSTGQWTGEDAFTGGAGNTKGTLVSRKCPSGYAVSGFSGRAGEYVDRLAIECTELRSNGAFNTANRYPLTALGGTGGAPFGVTRCGVPARAIVGKADLYIDSLELACEGERPRMTRNAINDALSDASEILFDDAGTNDVSCEVELQRAGRVRIEPGNGLSNISSEADITKACRLGFAVVTQEINYCGEGLTTSAAGCAVVGAPCMILTPQAQVDRAQLWAHEFGHTRGLGHRNGATTIMNEALNYGDTINNAECNAFRSQAPITVTGGLFAQSAAAPSVRDYVSQTFFHGVPYAESVAYGTGAVPELVALLADRKFEEHWGKVAAVLSMIADARGVDAVIALIERQDDTALAVRRQALVSLGYAANKGNTRALEYLQQSLTDGIWSKRALRLVSMGRLTSEDVEQEGDDELDSVASLRRAAAMGLALSGNAAARSSLQTGFRKGARERELLSTFVGELNKVNERGLARYDAERGVQAERAPHPKLEPLAPPLPPDVADR